MRATLLLVLGLAALWGVLGMLHVLPLPFGLATREADGLRAGLPLEGPGAPGADTATLEGGVARKKPVAVAPPAPPAPPQARGSVPHGALVRGRVVAEGEPRVPQAGAKVRLVRPHTVTTFLKTPAEGRWDVLEAQTGEDGRFAFLDVRPSAGYVVRARLGERTASLAQPVDLVERQVLDLDDLVLGPSGALEGRVVDGGGAPLAGVRVAASWSVPTVFGMVFPDPALLPEIEAETSSDAEGRFRLAPLERGAKTLVVASTTHGATVRSNVEVGERTDLGDLALGAAGVIAGRVEWEDGKPARDVLVFAIEGNGANGTLFSTRSAADGSFRLEHLEGDPLRMGVYLSGLMGLPSTPVALGTLDTLLKLPLAGALVGRVVRKADGRPVPRFGVRIEPQDKEPWMTRALRLMLDRVVGPQSFVSPDGTFRLPLVARGTHLVAVSAQGFPETKSERVEVAPGGTADAGTIALVDGHALGGTVRTTLGEPLARAELRLLADKGTSDQDDEIDWEPSDGSTAADAVSDEEGRFVLPPQTPGAYLLYVHHPFAVGHLERGLDLKSGPRMDLDLRLEPAGKVRVRVVDAVGRPARSEPVMLLRADGSDWTDYTDAEGLAHFEAIGVGSLLVRWRNARPYALLAAFQGAGDDAARTKAYEVLRADMHEEVVRAGQETEVTLRLPARVHVTVRVVPWGENLKITMLGISDPASNIWYGTVRASAGVFELDVEPGVYRVYAVPDPGRWEASKEFDGVTIPDAPTHTLELGR